MMKFRCS